MGAERRDFTRHAVHGGNAEIEAVMGRGRKPKERARVLDWSQGGLALKVPSPRRRFLFQRQDPVLFEDDSINCTLRLPPNYTEVFVSADVVHVRRDPSDPDSLFVGLRFDLENTPEEKLAALSAILEPRARTVSGRLRRTSATSERLSARLSAEPKASRRSKRVSARASRVSERRQRLEEE